MTNILNDVINLFSPITETFSTPVTTQFDQSDTMYHVSDLDQKSYKVDQIQILPKNLKHVKINNLSEFQRTEILQIQLAKWNTHTNSSAIQIHFPQNNSDYSLSKLSFSYLEGETPSNGKLVKKVLKLKDYWPSDGTLAFKPEEGLKIRKTLGLSLDQQIKILTNKELPDTPRPTPLILNIELAQNTNNDTVPSQDSEFLMIELNNFLLTTPTSINGPAIPSPLASSFGNVSPLNETFNNMRNVEEINILGRSFVLGSELLEDSYEDLLDQMDQTYQNSTRRNSLENNTNNTLPSYLESENYESLRLNIRSRQLNGLNTPSTLVDRTVFHNLNRSNSSPEHTSNNLLVEID